MQYSTIKHNNDSKSCPSLRGNVAECDKGEVNNSSNTSTPSSAKADTSPQSREGLESRKKLKNYHSKNYTEKAFNNARNLRKKENTTEAEKLLWYYIKQNQLMCYRFRRQVAVGNYIVDFLCPEKKLVIELDGSQHNEKKAIVYDNERTKYLNNLGYKVIRFWDCDIFKNMNGILETIYEELKNTPIKKILPLLEGKMPEGQIGSFNNKNISTPSSAKADTSPQSREGLKIKKGN